MSMGRTPLLPFSRWLAALHDWRRDATLRRILRNSAWLFGASAAGTAMNAVQGVLIGRALGLTAFGVLGVVFTFVSVFSRLTSFRLNEFIVQYLTRPEAQDRQRSAAIVKLSLCVEIGAALIAFALLWLAAPFAARWAARAPDATALIRAYGAVVLVNAMSETTQGILQVYGRYKTCSVASGVGSAMSLAAVIAVLAIDLGLAGVVAARLTGELLTTMVLGLTTLGEVRRRLGRTWWTAPLRTLAAERRAIVKFVSSTNATLTLSMLSKDGDLLWLGLLRGPAEAGLYRLAHLGASLAFLPVGLLAPSISPDVTGQAARLRWQEFRVLLHRTSMLAASYVGPVVALIALLHTPVIRLLLGEQFVPAGPALVILSVGMGISSIVVWGRLGLLALNRADYLMRVHLVVIPIKVIGVLTVVKAYGHHGAAALVAAIYIGAGVACALKIRRIARRDESLDARPIPPLAVHAEG
jgi:O-antigen/teichoic acid export membrane protein